MAVRVSQLRPWSASMGSTSSERDLFSRSVSRIQILGVVGDCFTITHFPDRLAHVISGGAAMVDGLDEYAVCRLVEFWRRDIITKDVN
jgi:hypothetical protein